jgi:hypothetical protein
MTFKGRLSCSYAYLNYILPPERADELIQRLRSILEKMQGAGSDLHTVKPISKTL